MSIVEEIDRLTHKHPKFNSEKDEDSDVDESTPVNAEQALGRAALLDVMVTPSVQIECVAEVCGPAMNGYHFAREHGIEALVNRIVFTAYPPFRKYLVIRVRHDMTIQSQMPASQVYASFEQRMFAVQGLRVVHRDAPMLEVCLFGLYHYDDLYSMYHSKCQLCILLSHSDIDSPFVSSFYCLCFLDDIL